MNNELLTTSDVSKILQTTPENVRLLERKGKLHAERTASGIRLFTRETVERFAEQRRQKHEPA